MVTSLIDTKDRKILNELDFNARQSNSEIARKVGLSKEVVNYRIRNLEKAEIVTSGLSLAGNFMARGPFQPVALTLTQDKSSETAGISAT